MDGKLEKWVLLWDGKCYMKVEVGGGGGQFVGVIIITWDENRRTFDWHYIGNFTLGIWSQGLVARVEIKKKRWK